MSNVPQLTDRQRNLLQLINQISQNTSAVIGREIEHSVDLPTVDFNLDLGGLTRSTSPTTPPGDTPTPPADSSEPTTLNELLSSLVNEQVEITTPYGLVSGVLLAVKDDYVVVVEDGAQVIVRIGKIELVSEL